MELTVVDSTNIYAMDRLQANLAAHGAAFFAHHQTAGKGQRGKTWSDEAGNNIALSVIIDPSFLFLSNQFPLSVMVAAGCYDFFSKYAGDETSIKWPNDLYWRDRKAGGILIENQVRGNKWQGAVAGMGININQASFSETLKNPVSLKQITGKNYDVIALAKELCICLDFRYQQLQSGQTALLHDFYNRHLYQKDRQVKLKKDNRSFICTIQEVSLTGELVVANGPQERFRFGEVEWVLPSDQSR